MAQVRRASALLEKKLEPIPLNSEQVRIIESNQHSPFYRSRFRVQLRINVRKGEIFHHFHDRLYSNENTWHGALEERYEALVWRGGEEERGPI